jgi:hypothetical protein
MWPQQTRVIKYISTQSYCVFPLSTFTTTTTHQHPPILQFSFQYIVSIISLVIIYLLIIVFAAKTIHFFQSLFFRPDVHQSKSATTPCCRPSVKQGQVVCLSARQGGMFAVLFACNRVDSASPSLRNILFSTPLNNAPKFPKHMPSLAVFLS